MKFDVWKMIEMQLGFDKVREKVKKMCVSSCGVEAIEELEFTDDIRVVMSDLELVSEMKRILTSEQAVPLHGFQDVYHALFSIKSDNQLLDPVEIFKIGRTLSVVTEMTDFIYNTKGKYPSITEICDELEPFEDIEAVITKSVDSEGYVLDSASSALKSIRNRITVTENRLRSKVKESFDVFKHAGYAREEEVTIRNGRLVIPVKSEHKGKVKGVVHDESASGNTVFIEPLESLQVNSELNKLYQEEKREVERIIRSIISQIFPFKNEMIENLNILTELDVIYAKAKYSIKYDCSHVKVNDKNIVNIYTGYHPLLLDKHNKADVVPLSVEMGEKYNTLVISGPNAGGKTVTLKTIGLYSLMIKAGMHVPCESHSNLAVFKNMFVDIGDEQSIESDLSTFSSHIEKISRTLKTKEKRTLILLDEIGAATDPAEGSALSMSILEDYTKRGFTCVVTTHQGILKSFAYRTEGIENGSMEFDKKTLSPTYRFRPAIPGSSYAFEISRRHGLPGYIIDRAKEHLGSEKQELETLISDLDEKITKYNTLLRGTKNTSKQLEELREHYDKKYLELKKNEKKILKEAAKRGEAVVAEANRMIENAIAEIRSSNADKDVIKKIRTEVMDKKEKFVKQAKDNQEKTKKYTGELKEGLEIRVDGYSNWGIIRKISKNGKKVDITIGNFDMTVSREKILEAKLKKESNVSVTLNYTSADDFTGFTLDLRGYRGVDAIDELDKYLDNCKIKNLKSVEIVHGKGEGILARLVHEHLEKHPLVRRKSFGKAGYGDYGVTIVELV